MNKKITEFIKSLKGKKIHIVGFTGTESSAVAIFLNKHGVKGLHLHDFCEEKQVKKHFKNAHLALSTKEQDSHLQALLNLKANFYYQENYLKGIQDADIIFVPQAWYMYENNQQLTKLQSKKQFLSITKLYFQLSPAPIIAVTGSNGKTTTSNLINHLFAHAKHPYNKIWFSGNDRGTHQILENIEEITNEDLLILEVSNRQLKVDLGKAPHIGVITNITQNHLKEYKSFAEYVDGKFSLLERQTANDFAVLNIDDPVIEDRLDEFKNIFGFSTKKVLDVGAFVRNNTIYLKPEGKLPVLPICKVEILPLIGQHNLSNTLAAFSACYLAKINPGELAKAVSSFEGVAQRQEFIDKINKVEYYNDTSSTSPESLLVAVEALGPDMVLIMGGRNKNLDINQLSVVLQEQIKQIIFLDSPFADEVKATLKPDYLANTKTVKTLKEAVSLAHKIAKPKSKVVLSPGAEYFVYFKDKMPGYKNFRTFVAQLKKKTTSPL